MRQIGAEIRHAIGPPRRRATAMSAQIDAQHREARVQQHGHLFGPHRHVGGQRMHQAHRAIAARTQQVGVDAPAVAREDHQSTCTLIMRTISAQLRTSEAT
jgi:hypothetical protein